MPSYKFYYFDLAGRGEAIRMLLTVAGVPFEDIRVKSADWPAMKPKMPLGKMPVLEIDGKMLPQTRAIYYYVAREFNLYGATNWESAQMDIIGEFMFDLAKPFAETVMFEKDPTKKAEMSKKFFGETAPPILQQVEDQLKKNKGGDGFLVGDKISMADITAFATMKMTKPDDPSYMDKYPKLKAFLSRVASNPKLAAYLAKQK